MKLWIERCDAMDIRNNAWAGAISTMDLLSDEEIELIDRILTESCPEGMEAVEYNDFWWFDTDTIAEWLGFSSFEELYEKRR